MKGFRNVFTFTFRQLTIVKSYRLLTLVLALLLFFVPALLLPLTQSGDYEEGIEDFQIVEALPIEEEETEVVTYVTPEVIYYVNNSSLQTDWYTLLSENLTSYENTRWVNAASMEEANQQGAGVASLIFLVTDGYQLKTSFDAFPAQGSLCSFDDAGKLIDDASEQSEAILMKDLSAEQLQTFKDLHTADNGAAAAAEEIIGEEEEVEEEDDFLYFIATLLLPYLNVLIVYFLVLYYGQGAANAIILEKTNKLMDTMLVSLKPRDMILGKTFGTWAASVLQFLIWAVSLVAGLSVGSLITTTLNPNTDSMLIIILNFMKDTLGQFSVPYLILALVIILAGFFLFCALASIGGALARKPEELSSTNFFFMIPLIVSFFAALYSGFLNDSLGAGISWIDLVPTTAVMISPARLILGHLPLYMGFVILGINLLTSLLIMTFSGKLYTMMSMYKGNLPSIGQIFRMFKGA